jgi:hypothetical protein
MTRDACALPHSLRCVCAIAMHMHDTTSLAQYVYCQWYASIG